MKKKALILIIFIGLLVVLKSQFVSAAIDAPHNECNNISCGSCHGQGLLMVRDYLIHPSGVELCPMTNSV
jgi:hypothetical protein